MSTDGRLPVHIYGTHVGNLRKGRGTTWPPLCSPPPSRWGRGCARDARICGPGRCLEIGRRCGLTAFASEVLNFAGSPALLYDALPRVLSPDGQQNRAIGVNGVRFQPSVTLANLVAEVAKNVPLLVANQAKNLLNGKRAAVSAGGPVN